MSGSPPSRQAPTWGGQPAPSQDEWKDWKRYTNQVPGPYAFERSTDYYGGVKEMNEGEFRKATQGLTTTRPKPRKWFQQQNTDPVKVLFVNGKWTPFYKRN